MIDAETQTKSFAERLILETQALPIFSDRCSKLVNFLLSVASHINLSKQDVDALTEYRESTADTVNARLALFEKEIKEYRIKKLTETVYYTTNSGRECPIKLKDAVAILDKINFHCLSMLYPILLDDDLTQSVYKRKKN